MRARRALLYMPGNDWRKIEKGSSLKVDSICMDLEDGVAPDKKEEAREVIVRALSSLDFGKRERLVRINPIGSGLEQADLEAVLAAKPDGLVVPKASSAEDIRFVAEAMRSADCGECALLALIESALGLVNVKEIAASDEALDGLIFGAEDYAADLGAKRSKYASEVYYARSAIVAHAAAFDLQAIDMLWTNYQDNDTLRALAMQGSQLGYSGMQIIHPKQIEVVQAAFTPTEKEIGEAQRIVEGYEGSLADGKGAFALDGKMVDMPIVKAAQAILARGKAD